MLIYWIKYYVFLWSFTCQDQPIFVRFDLIISNNYYYIKSLSTIYVVLLEDQGLPEEVK